MVSDHTHYITVEQDEVGLVRGELLPREVTDVFDPEIKSETPYGLFVLIGSNV